MKEKANNWAHLVDTGILCPDMTDEEYEKIVLNGNMLNPTFKIMSVKIYPCLEIYPGYCETPDLNKEWDVNFLQTKHSFDPANKTTPTRVQIVMDKFFPMHRRVKLNRRIEFNKNCIFDDDYDYVEQTLRQEYFTSDLPDTTSFPRRDTATSHTCSLADMGS